ncbi:hypothetical protein GUJ93_ZPchr0012g20391 [Zizania palustris]|uniref:Uncharacterized protein n=1 Tax=Zizania palustris TaxID=103762 RepID=A0A8J5WNQ4_ZIZPA|nr:hypothetical protein GUJ93_ZPchr0012g20391 [Zizania palustris]
MDAHSRTRAGDNHDCHVPQERPPPPPHSTKPSHAHKSLRPFPAIHFTGEAERSIHPSTTRHHHRRQISNRCKNPPCSITNLPCGLKLGLLGILEGWLFCELLHGECHQLLLY